MHGRRDCDNTPCHCACCAASTAPLTYHRRILFNVKCIDLLILNFSGRSEAYSWRSGLASEQRHKSLKCIVAFHSGISKRDSHCKIFIWDYSNHWRRGRCVREECGTIRFEAAGILEIKKYYPIFTQICLPIFEPTERILIVAAAMLRRRWDRGNIPLPYDSPRTWFFFRKTVLHSEAPPGCVSPSLADATTMHVLQVDIKLNAHISLLSLRICCNHPTSGSTRLHRLGTHK